MEAEFVHYLWNDLTANITKVSIYESNRYFNRLENIGTR